MLRLRQVLRTKIVFTVEEGHQAGRRRHGIYIQRAALGFVSPVSAVTPYADAPLPPRSH